MPPNAAGGGHRLFPIPVPSPPIAAFSNSPSRRCQRRARNLRALSSLSSSCVRALNTLASSFASSSSTSVSASSVTAPQSRVLRFVHQQCSRYHLRRQQQPASSDQFAPLQQHILPSGYFDKAAAIWITAANVSLPSRKPNCHIADILPPAVRSQYATPSAAVLRPAEEVPAELPRASMLCSKSEYILLLRRLKQLGMISFRESVKAVNGLFGVTKDDGRTRLIADFRPANAFFKEPPHTALPTPDLLASLHGASKQKLWIAKSDLADFYHSLLVPDWLQDYFGLPAVHAADVGEGANHKAGALIYPVLRTLPMGWSHSLHLAQTAHEQLVYTKSSIRPEDAISHGTDSELDRTRHAIYVDDISWIGPSQADVQRQQDEYAAIFRHVDLWIKWAKFLRPTQRPTDVIGMEIDPSEARVGLSVPKLEALVQDTEAALAADSISKGQFRRLLGRWTWALLIRRPALSALSAVFKFIQNAPAVATIWPTVRAELRVVVGLAPLLSADLAQDWFSRVIASDASQSGLGVCASEPCWSAEPVDLALTNSPALDDWVLMQTWHTIVASRWRRLEHIASLEARAASTAVRWAVSIPSAIGCKVVLISDNQTVVAALSKGRSSSYSLLRRLRTVAAAVLAAGIHLITLWVPSDLNPSDEPSRQ